MSGGIGYEQRLLQAAQTLELPLTDTEAARLVEYLDLLSRWNRTYNLTALREPEQMLVQHLFDCLAVIPALRRRALSDGARVLDVGSGAGLPGIVIAMLCPSLRVTCVDTVGKKAAFIRQAAGSLKLTNLQSEHQRVELLKAAPFDLITSRAFASLVDFTTLTRLHLTEGGVWMAMKGRAPDAELAELPDDIDVFHVEQLQVPSLDAERCLVWLRPRAKQAAGDSVKA